MGVYGKQHMQSPNHGHKRETHMDCFHNWLLGTDGHSDAHSEILVFVALGNPKFSHYRYGPTVTLRGPGVCIRFR
jgi:hypothetical protein